MGSCLKPGAMCLVAAATLAAASPDGIVRRVSSVKADPHTGRLVRTVRVSSTGAGPRHTKAVDRFVQDTARLYDIDPLLVHSVIAVESNYDPFAVSPKGAEGLMQLMPETAKRLAVKDSFNPWDNIEGGVRYLKYLLTRFGDPKLAVAAYNAGEGAVLKYGDIPPYRETAAYVQKVDRKLGEAKQAAKQPETPPAESRPVLAQYVDPEGRVHLETR